MNTLPEHLAPGTAAMLGADVDARVRYVQKGVWIGYRRARAVLERLEELIEHVQTHRMPCLLLAAETNNGKSYLMKRFRSLHPSADDPDAEAAHHPVVIVRAPEAPDQSQFYSNVLDAVKAPHRPTAPLVHKHDQVLTVLKAVRTRMLVVDEVQHIIGGGAQRQRTFRNTLKLLAEDLQIPLVACGIPDAKEAFASDEQLQNRFKLWTLPRWDNDADFTRLLASFEALLPLPGPSRLTESKLQRDLHILCNGRIGDLAEVLKTAAVRAIKAGRPALTRELIEGAADQGT